MTQPGIGWDVDPGVESRVFPMGDGEDAKHLGTVEDLCRDLAQWGLTRADVVVAVGGGVVTDVAGFVASVYHRGVPVVHVPTSLLGQVDAAIGGKTGVNLPEGKNLVGAYWQPSAVLCDTETLATLPPREQRSGRGEMAKYAFLGVDDLPDLPLDEAVAACVRCKAEVVASDEREGGRRAILNYGHTLAHALETAGGYDLRHGEAVAIGLVYAAEVARRLGRIDDARVAEHRKVVAGYDLPLDLPPGLDPDELVDLFGRDKKAVTGHHLRPRRAGGRRARRRRRPRPPPRRPGGDPWLTRSCCSSRGRTSTCSGSASPRSTGRPRWPTTWPRPPPRRPATAWPSSTSSPTTRATWSRPSTRARGRCAAIVVNAGALTHYGWSLHDALAAFEGPVVELHLSNPGGREPWRHTSVLAPVAAGTIAGFGGDGYRLAVDAVARLLGPGSTP